LIDTTLRREVNIPSNIVYFLIDMQDNTIVDLSSLSHLNDESNILIKIRDANSLQEKEWLSKSTVDH
jgi:hypothetical protein